MNRNFAKISVSIVALLLALVLCFTSCSGKIDDVTADLNSTKDEVAANKADATEALNEAVKNLEAKIAANKTDVAAEIAAVNAAIEAVKTSGATADAELAKAQEALQASVNLVQANLESAKKEVSDKLAANDAALNEKLAELNQAIADAKEVLKLADATDVARLLETIDGVEKAFGTKIEEVVANVAEFKKEVEFWVSELEGADAETLVQVKAELEALLVKVGEMDTQVEANLGVAIADAIKVVNDRLETYKLTTDDVIDAYYSLNKILAIYNEVSASYGETYIMEGDQKVAVDLDRALTTVQIKLYRATTPEEVHACKNEFFNVIENIQSENLTILRGIYEKLLFAEAELANDDDLDPNTKVNLPETKAALVEAKAALELTFSAIDAKLIVGGEVIDLKAMYADLWEDYCATRISEIESYIEDAEAGIAAGDVAYDTLWAVNGESLTISDNLGIARDELDDLIADNDTLADADKVSAEEIARLEGLYDTARQNRAKKAIELVTAEIADVTNKADVDRDTTDETTTVDAKIEFIETENNTITAPVSMDAIKLARDTKYVEIYAAELTEDMNAFIDNLTAIYNDVVAVDGGADSEIDAIRADYAGAFVDATYADIYANSTADSVVALKAAEEKFVKVEAQDDKLGALVDGVAAINAILDNDEFKIEIVNDVETFPNISGTKTEFDVLNSYIEAVYGKKDADGNHVNGWIDDLNALAAEFTLPAKAEDGSFVVDETTDAAAAANAEKYTAIRALVEEADYNKFNNAFEEAIAELKEIAIELTNSMLALKEAVEVTTAAGAVQEYKFYFTTIDTLDEVWEDYWAWVGKAGDDQGVGFVIEWVSEGELTQAELIETINKIDAAYSRWFNKATQDWVSVYTKEVSELTVDNVTIYNDKELAAVINWFETYCYWNDTLGEKGAYECIVDNAYAAAHSFASIGTSEIEAIIRTVDAKRADLLAGAKAGIESITNTEFAAITQVSTHAADVEIIEAARAAYTKWVSDYRIEVDNARNAELGVAFDITTLTEAETKLAELKATLADLILAIESIDTNINAPYFKNDSVKDFYKMNNEAIQADVDTFVVANNCEEGCTECFSEDLQDKLAEAHLIVAKYETLVEFTAKAETYRAQINTESEYATWANEEIDNLIAKATMEIGDFTIDTPNVYIVLSAICGDQADADFAEIIAKTNA